jgi:hypothetical protein
MGAEFLDTSEDVLIPALGFQGYQRMDMPPDSRFVFTGISLLGADSRGYIAREADCKLKGTLARKKPALVFRVAGHN